MKTGSSESLDLLLVLDIGCCTMYHNRGHNRHYLSCTSLQIYACIRCINCIGGVNLMIVVSRVVIRVIFRCELSIRIEREIYRGIG